MCDKAQYLCNASELKTKIGATSDENANSASVRDEPSDSCSKATGQTSPRIDLVSILRRTDQFRKLDH